METHVQCLALKFAQKGMRVSVICINDRRRSGGSAGRIGPLVESAEIDAGVRVLRVGRWLSMGSVDAPRGLVRSIREVLTTRPDIVHLHAPNPVMTIALHRAGLAAPLAVTHHSDIIRQSILRRLFAPWQSWAYRRAGAIITTSEEYLSHSPVLAPFVSKVHCIPLGVDLTPFLQPSVEALAEEARIRRAFNSPLWLVVGRLVYYKGVETAIRALREIDGSLLVIGTGPMREQLSRVAARQGVAGRVHFLGHVGTATVVGAYRAATALLFPSTARSEAFGLAQVEAMASGCPVINTAIPGSGVSWVSRNGESGLTVPPGDPSALAEAANRLATEPALRERLGHQGRVRAVAEFNQDRMAEETLVVYEEILRSAAE